MFTAFAACWTGSHATTISTPSCGVRWNGSTNCNGAAKRCFPRHRCSRGRGVSCMIASLRMLGALLLVAVATSSPAAEPKDDAEKQRPLPCHIVPASGLALKTGKHSATADVEELPRPGKGDSYRDPDYGVCVVRVTDHDHEPPTGFARNYYSRFQPFNADESLLLVFARNGEWHLYDSAT